MIVVGALKLKRTLSTAATRPFNPIVRPSLNPPILGTPRTALARQAHACMSETSAATITLRGIEMNGVIGSPFELRRNCSQRHIMLFLFSAQVCYKWWRFGNGGSVMQPDEFFKKLFGVGAIKFDTRPGHGFEMRIHDTQPDAPLSP